MPTIHYAWTTTKKVWKHEKKSPAKEMRQKNDISECRSKGWRALHRLQLLLCLQQSHYWVTVRSVRGYLTQKMNITSFYQKLDAEYFFIWQFFRRKQYFPRKLWKIILGSYLTIFWGKGGVLFQKLNNFFITN